MCPSGAQHLLEKAVSIRARKQRKIPQKKVMQGILYDMRIVLSSPHNAPFTCKNNGGFLTFSTSISLMVNLTNNKFGSTLKNRSKLQHPSSYLSRLFSVPILGKLS